MVSILTTGRLIPARAVMPPPPLKGTRGSAELINTRSGGLASLGGACHPGQHHPAAAAGEMPPAQPCRERLAVHARQLAVKPHLQILRRHPRPLLLRMEPPHGSAVANYVHRTAPMGPWVNVCESWYQLTLQSYLRSCWHQNEQSFWKTNVCYEIERSWHWDGYNSAGNGSC